MANKDKITLPSSFIDIIDDLNENVSIEEIEKKIIEQARAIFNVPWGSIKYYYGNQFVDGYSSVPDEYKIQPRKNGYMFKTVQRSQPYLITEDILRKVHPEAHKNIKTILLAPLRMDADTVASVSLVDLIEHRPTTETMKMLEDFGMVYGRVLRMAHKFAAEKRASTNREKFMSFAAHELKNPLMTLSSYNHIIKKTLDNKGKIQAEWLEKMANEINRMKSLINELLDVKMSQEGELQYTKEKVKIKDLIRQVCDNFRITHPTRQLLIRYQIEDSDTILGDEIKLSQVFINLLSNAQKFSDEASKINVIVKKTDSFYEIFIEDKGMGISADEVPYIFNEFYRGTNGEKEKGIGIGLYLVKSIINSHHGKIRVESELGKGTNFKVYLPNN